MDDEHPLKAHAHIGHVEKLYLEVLYRCNFECRHCFQGVNLKRPERFTLDEATRAIAHFADHFGLSSVTICGGEPFLHPDLEAMLAFAKLRGLDTVVCTNGYRIHKILTRVASDLDHLRVSVDGLCETHDAIRRPGSFKACVDTLLFARAHGIRTSITMTVTNSNVGDIGGLAAIAAECGADHIKLHELRPIGHAADHPDLIVAPGQRSQLTREVRRAARDVPVFLDEDASPAVALDRSRMERTDLDRIEIQPDGRLYVSCKAVGADSNAFWYDKAHDCVEYRPADDDELAARTPQVRYVEI